MYPLQARTGDNPLHASDQMPCWSPQESNCELCTRRPLFPAKYEPGKMSSWIITSTIVKKLTYSTLVKCVTFFKYFSTSHGTCERLLKPPKAVPFQTRPVTNWKGRVLISCPDAATPTITDVPQPCKFLVNREFYACRYHLSHKFTQNTHLMAALQSGPHHWDISNALETVVNTTISEINKNLLNWLIIVLWIHKFGNSKILCCGSQCNISK